MLKCNYCGRMFKKSYESCPGCGASSFIKVANANNITITTPPQGGYKLDFSNFKKDKLIYRIFFWLGIFISIVFILPEIPILFLSLFADFSFSLFFLPFILIPLIVSIPFILFGRAGLKKIDKNIEKVKLLQTKGILVKNLNYDIVPTGTVINGRRIYAISVIYENQNGVKIPLTSEGKYDGQLSRADGTVDLLIDPNDSSNYYIDFEIY